MTGHSILNIESFIGLAFMLALLFRSQPIGGTTQNLSPRHYIAVFAILFIAMFIAYGRALNSPFLYDDYTHIADARDATLTTILAGFGPLKNQPGLFFRPFASMSYWLSFWVFGVSASLWHLSSILFHVAASWLLYVLCRELRFGYLGSAAAALLFAINAAATEIVVWIDARFDSLSTALVLVSLIGVCRFVSCGRCRWIAIAGIAGLLALLTKESAFCLPLLAATLWFFVPERSGWRRLAFASGFLGLLTAIVFTYRWWAIGGLGGYADSHFSLIRSLEVMFARVWALLFYPVNWSGAPTLPLSCFLFTSPIVMAVCATWIRLPRRMILGVVLFVVFSALPVCQLLLIATDLANARYLYLISIGWAILWAAIFTRLRRARWGLVLVILSLSGQLLMLSHNLNFWLSVPTEARNACADFGASTSQNDQKAIVGRLPQKKNGVPFLLNGFAQCVEMNSKVPASRIGIIGDPTHTWDPATGRIVPRL